MPVLTTHFRILFAFIATVSLGTACSDQDTAPPAETGTAEPMEQQITETAESAAIEIQEAVPQAQPETAADEPQQAAATEQAPETEQSTAVDGMKIYQTSCLACHANGIAGAPKLGDKEAWAPRIAKGTDALFSSVLNGLNAMPPKGTCMSCSDDELRAAMEYMIGESS